MNESQQARANFAWQIVNGLCEELDERYTALLAVDASVNLTQALTESRTTISALKDARHALAKIRTSTNAD